MEKQEEGKCRLHSFRRNFNGGVEEPKFGKKRASEVLHSTGGITFFLAIIVLIICVIFYALVAEMRVVYQRYNKEQLEQEIETVLLTKDYVDSMSTIGLMEIAANIRKEITETLDMDALEKELNKGNIPSDLSSIFSKYLKGKTTIPGQDPNVNNIVVCMENGIVADFSKVYSSYDDSTRTWEVEKSHELNPQLFNNSLRAILDQNTRILYVEQYQHIDTKADDEDRILYPYINETILRNIYMVDGIEGLREYTFLVPVYIDADGDIFGNADIVNGKRIKNNKFIIIQRYSLYEFIKHHNIDDKFEQGVGGTLKAIEFMIMLSSVLIILLSVIIVVFMAKTANDEVDKDTNNQEDA